MSATRIIWLITNLIVLVIFAIWYYETRDWEPLAALIAAFGGIVVFFITGSDKKSESTSPGVKQTIRGGNDSINIQSGRDTNLGK